MITLICTHYKLVPNSIAFIDNYFILYYDSMKLSIDDMRAFVLSVRIVNPFESF